MNIEYICAEIVGGCGVATLTVDRYDEALWALAQTAFQAISEDAIVIRLDDKPGESARITSRLNQTSSSL